MAGAIATQQQQQLLLRPVEDNQLHNEYRAILQMAKDEKHDLAAGNGNKIKSLLADANALHERVRRPREQAMDAQVFALATEGGVDFVKKLARGTKSYTTADFVRRLKARYVDDDDAQEAGRSDPSAFDWGALGRGLAAWFRTAPYCHHMLGPMDAVPKAKRVVAQRRKRDEVAAVVRPSLVADLAAEDRQETDRNMEEMWRVLKEHGGSADLLELVLNHRSFPQTMENCFSLSFLVRDGRVSLRDGPRGLVVAQTPRAEWGAGTGNEADRVQFVMTQSMEVWEEWRRVVPEGTTLMKHRQEFREPGDGGGEQRQQRRQQPQQHQQENGAEQQGGPSAKRSRR